MPGHRRKLMRLANYDYASSGSYFLTLCADQRRCIFGQIHNMTFQPSKLGQLVLDALTELPVRYQRLQLDEHVVMPNHVHLILNIYSEFSAARLGLLTGRRLAIAQVPIIVGRFKAGVTKRYRNAIGDRSYIIWQRGFWDYVIRNEEGLARAREYIRTNLLSWHLDRENPRATGMNDFYIHWRDEISTTVRLRSEDRLIEEAESQLRGAGSLIDERHS